jgi:hypothetical protein
MVEGKRAAALRREKRKEKREKMRLNREASQRIGRWGR